MCGSTDGSTSVSARTQDILSSKLWMRHGAHRCFLPGGASRNSTIIMCGSSGNLIRNFTKEHSFSAYSDIAYLIELFHAIGNSSNSPLLPSTEHTDATTEDFLQRDALSQYQGTHAAAIRRSQETVNDLIDGGLLGNCEFLAKRIRTASHEGDHFSVATPLFVALLD
jgi:hypothetical protein